MGARRGRLRSGARIGLAGVLLALACVGAIAAQAANESLVVQGSGASATTKYLLTTGTQLTISGVLMDSGGSEVDAFYRVPVSPNQQPNQLPALYAKSAAPGSTTHGQLSAFLESYPAYEPSHVYHVVVGSILGRTTFCAFDACNGNSGYSGSLSMALTAEYAPPQSSGNSAGVASVQGEVTVIHADGSVEPVASTTVLGRGDQLATGVDAKVTMTFQDGSRMTLGEMTRMYVADLLVQGSRQNVQVAIKLGEVSAQVNPKKGYQTDFKVSTPSGTTSSRGTVFTVFYDPVAKATIVRTLVHKVVFTPRRRGATAVIVPAGKEIYVTLSRVSKLAPIGKAGARGGIDIQQAHDLALGFVDRFVSACGLTSPGAGATVKPAGRAAWTVTIPVQGKATGSSTWRVAAGRVSPINALAKQIVAGCH
jgi:FecR protein